MAGVGTYHIGEAWLSMIERHTLALAYEWSTGSRHLDHNFRRNVPHSFVDITDLHWDRFDSLDRPWPYD